MIDWKIKDWALTSPYAMTMSNLFVPPLFRFLAILHLKQSIVSFLNRHFYWHCSIVYQMTKSEVNYSLPIVKVDSSSSRHLLQVGMLVNPNLERCLFRWECPVCSPVAHRNWFLLNFKSSLLLLAEVLYGKPFAYLNPFMDSQHSLWFLFVLSLTTVLPTVAWVLHAGSCPINGHSDSNLAN